jgi:prepilin-type N-terminal cleavage/methylation domain-containing protein
MKAACRAKSAGFTLIEIMCVMVILAIAAAMVFAGLGDLTSQNSFQAQAEARQVLADLLYAQNRAIATQSNVYVTFNTASSTTNGVAGQTYALCSALPSTFLTNPVSQASYTNSWSGKTWSISSASLNGQTAMYFDPLGMPWTCTATGSSGALMANNASASPSPPFPSSTYTPYIAISSGGYTVYVAIQPSTGDMTILY